MPLSVHPSAASTPMAERIIRQIPLVLLLVLVGCLAGCVNLDPANDPTRYYLLDPPAVPTTDEPNVGIHVALKPVELPAYLNRQAIAVRQAQNELAYQDFHRWAEDLAKTIERNLAADLLMKTSIATVDSFPRDRAHPANWIVSVSFEQLEGNQNGNVTMIAKWSARPPNAETHTFRGRLASTDSWKPDDFRSLAAAHDRLVAKLADAIAADLERHSR